MMLKLKNVNFTVGKIQFFEHVDINNILISNKISSVEKKL